jgi:hypothetical protein
VTHKSQRRQGGYQPSPDAATEHAHCSTSPNDAEALAALRTLRAWMAAGVSPSLYDQDRRPPDCRSRDAYLRRHRELRKAGVAGAWARGKTLACTPEAWAHDLPRASKVALVPAPLLDVDSEIAAALGVRARRVAR